MMTIVLMTMLLLSLFLCQCINIVICCMCAILKVLNLKQSLELHSIKYKGSRVNEELYFLLLQIWKKKTHDFNRLSSHTIRRQRVAKHLAVPLWRYQNLAWTLTVSTVVLPGQLHLIYVVEFIANGKTDTSHQRSPSSMLQLPLSFIHTVPHRTSTCKQKKCFSNIVKIIYTSFFTHCCFLPLFIVRYSTLSHPDLYRTISSAKLDFML